MINAFTTNNILVLNRRLTLTTLCWKSQAIRLWSHYAERSS